MALSKAERISNGDHYIHKGGTAIVLADRKIVWVRRIMAFNDDNRLLSVNYAIAHIGSTDSLVHLTFLRNIRNKDYSFSYELPLVVDDLWSGTFPSVVESPIHVNSKKNLFSAVMIGKIKYAS